MADEDTPDEAKERPNDESSVSSDGEASSADQQGDSGGIDSQPVAGAGTEDDPWEAFEDEEIVGIDFEQEFEDMEVDEVDADDVWNKMAAAEAKRGAKTLGSVARGEVSWDAGSEPGRVVRIIQKRICESCEYFSRPPEVRCTHDGTTIEELLDAKHHKVINCPIVADQGPNQVQAEDD